MVREEALDLHAQSGFVLEVAEADRAAADLVFIGGADASAGSADLAGARPRLAGGVEVAVQR